MAAKSPTISVFVVSLDEDISPFTEFCRQGACDLVESTNPVIMFGLHTTGQKLPPSDVGMIFGQWPRYFKSLPALRDNLMDAVGDRLAKGHMVSIILVARSPTNKRIKNVIEPILEEIAIKRKDNTKLWPVGFFTCGPAHGLAAASAMVQGVDAKLRNVFFASDSHQSEGMELQQKDYPYLRFVIDLARDYGDTKKLFAESANKSYPKIIWIRDHDCAGSIFPIQLLGKLAQFFARIGNRGVDVNEAKDTEFEKQVDGYLTVIGPKLEEEAPDSIESIANDIEGKIPTSTGYSDSSIKNITASKKEIRKIFRAAYEKSEKNVLFQLSKADRAFRTISGHNKFKNFPLPGGGYSQQDKARINAKRNMLDENGAKWSSEALKARFDTLGDHGDLQNRPDPSKDGNFSFDALGEGLEFNENTAQAHVSATHLPNSSKLVWLLAFLPLSLAALTVFAHFQSNTFSKFDYSVVRELFSQQIILLLIGLGVLAIPIVVAFAWRINFKNIAKNKIAQMRVGAREIAQRLLKVSSNTSSYLVHTRSSLLASEGARKIMLRVKEQPFAKLQEQAKTLLGNIKPDNNAAVEEAYDGTFIEKNSPESWISNEIQSWRASRRSEKSKWEPKFEKSMSVTGLSIDKSATPDIVSPFPSSYSDGTSNITLAAIPPEKMKERQKEGE